MNLHLETELIEEVINEALNHISHKKDEHRIEVALMMNLFLAKKNRCWLNNSSNYKYC